MQQQQQDDPRLREQARDQGEFEGCMLCEFEHCTEPGTVLARGRDRHAYDQPGHREVGMFCERHAEIVADEGSPEYVVSCPNCSCRFGVN